MRIRKGFMLREIATYHVVVPEGLEVIDFRKLVRLNDSAKYLWESLQGQDFQVKDMTKLLTDKYVVTEEKAMADAKQLTEGWLQNGLLEE